MGNLAVGDLFFVQVELLLPHNDTLVALLLKGLCNRAVGLLVTVSQHQRHGAQHNGKDQRKAVAAVGVPDDLRAHQQRQDHKQALWLFVGAVSLVGGLQALKNIDIAHRKVDAVAFRSVVLRGLLQLLLFLCLLHLLVLFQLFLLLFHLLFKRLHDLALFSCLMYWGSLSIFPALPPARGSPGPPAPARFLG